MVRGKGERVSIDTRDPAHPQRLASSRPPAPANEEPLAKPAPSDRRVGLTPITLLLVLVVGYLLIQIQFVLVLVLLSLVFATVIQTPVDALDRRHVPRPLAILLVYVAIIGAITVLFMLLSPAIREQATAFREQAPQSLADLRGAWQAEWERAPRRSWPATARSWHRLHRESRSDSGNQRAAGSRARPAHGARRRDHRSGDGPHHLLLLPDGEIVDPADRAARLRSGDAHPRQPYLGRSRTEGRRLATRAADALPDHRRHRHDWLRGASHPVLAAPRLVGGSYRDHSDPGAVAGRRPRGHHRPDPGMGEGAPRRRLRRPAAAHGERGSRATRHARRRRLDAADGVHRDSGRDGVCRDPRGVAGDPDLGRDPGHGVALYRGAAGGEAGRAIGAAGLAVDARLGLAAGILSFSSGNKQ